MPRTYVDRGGTFTDVIVVEDDGTTTLRKVRSDVAVTADLQRGALTYGTTVVTNALLERRGVPTLLLISEGFGDLPQIRAMARPELFDPDAVWPRSLATRVIEVPGRMSADGVEVAPLALPPLDLAGIEAVAVVLLHAPANPAHEEAVEAAVRAVAPHLYVSIGHRLQPEPGYLARVETTLVDAALTPVLKTALQADGVPPEARLIRSDASLTARDDLLACDAVLSGPAGGVLAVQAIARQLGAPGAVGLDMGGTSTDVVCVLDHLPRHPADKPVAGVFLRRPMLAMETIAAGGGSVLWHDGLMPRVGPRSAGAFPGPQCYGAGGPPTITDAAVAAGLVDVAGFEPSLRADAVELPGPAQDFLDVAREAMAAAVQRLAGSWGVDPSTLPLVSFGGAAGQHAALVAERLGMREVVVHPFASGLSAWGQTLAVEADEAVRSVGPDDDLAAALTALQAALPARPQVERTLVMGARGTSSSLDVAWSADPVARASAFAAAHVQTFGFAPVGVAEVRAVRVRVSERPAASASALPDPWGLDARVICGPARVDGGATSVVVPPGWTARRVDGLLRLTRARAEGGATSAGAALAVWSSRLTSVAERAGEHLRRLARSVSVRDRRDFSCAVFDGLGRQS